MHHSDSKITVCKHIGQAILPNITGQHVMVIAERVQGKINEYIFQAGYKYHCFSN